LSSSSLSLSQMRARLDSWRLTYGGPRHFGVSACDVANGAAAKQDGASSPAGAVQWSSSAAARGGGLSSQGLRERLRTTTSHEDGREGDNSTPSGEQAPTFAAARYCFGRIPVQPDAEEKKKTVSLATPRREAEAEALRRLFPHRTPLWTPSPQPCVAATQLLPSRLSPSFSDAHSILAEDAVAPASGPASSTKC